MKKYYDLAKDIIEHVGGKENINEVHHCVTRLRFGLKDQSAADEAYLKNLDGVKGVIKNASEYMVVIGQHVPDVYEEVVEILGFQATEQLDVNEDGNKNILGKIMEIIFSSLSPALNALCACGLVKGLLSICILTGIMNSEMGIYQILSAVGDSIFYFLPIVLGINLAKKVKMDQFTALLIAASLVYPAINGVDLNVFGFTVNASYSQTFFPIILIVWLFAPLDRKLREKLPESIRGFIVPFIVLCIAVPLGFTIIGPFANMLSNWISVGINTMFGWNRVITGLILGGCWTILIMFGVHSAIGAVAWADLLNGNPSMILGVTTMTCFVNAVALIAIFLKTKDSQLKNLSWSTCISCIFGVTEPSLYGVIISRPKLIAMICAGNAVLGTMCGLLDVRQYTWAGFGISGIVGLFNETGSNIASVFIALGVALVVEFILVFIFFKDEKEKA